MLRRFQRALKHAMEEEDFAPVLAAGAFLIALGTGVYSATNGWSLAEGFYFSVATLTTASIANPELTIDDPWLEVFSAFYSLIGIGVLVEVVRRLGMAFVEVRRQDKSNKNPPQEAEG